MNVTSFDLCALHPTTVSEVFPSVDWGLRGATSIQSTPQAKPGPWKWDLWGSQLITAPIEVSPTFYTGKSQRVPTPWAIWRSEGLWKASHECLWKWHSPSLQPGHLAEDAPTGPGWSGVTKEQETQSDHFRSLGYTISVLFHFLL